MELHILKRESDLIALQPAWQRLWERAETAGVQLHYNWVLAGWKAFHSQDQLQLLAVFAKGQLTGVAPLVIFTDIYRGIRIRKLGFIRNAQSPANDFLILPGTEEAFLSLISRHLESFDGWDLVDLQRLDTGGATFAWLNGHYRRSCVRTGSRFNLESPFIRIDGDWCGFLRNRSPRFRKSLRNKLNRSRHLRVECSSPGADPDALVDEMLRISASSWRRTQGTDLGSSTGNTRFYRNLCALFAAGDQVRVWWLKQGDQAIAFEFHLESRGVVYPLRADFDENYRRLSPGSVLEHHLLRDLFARPGVREYNSCGHTYPYLMNWTGWTRCYQSFEVFSDSRTMRLLHGFEYRLLPLFRKAGLTRLAYRLRKLGRSHARHQIA